MSAKLTLALEIREFPLMLQLLVINGGAERESGVLGRADVLRLSAFSELLCKYEGIFASQSTER